MSSNSNKKKAEALGMPYGTASNRLKKQIMFKFIQNLHLDNCYHCKKLIDSVEDLSVEHKIPWLNSETPEELFWDLDNIAFSHLRCNYAKGIPSGITWKNKSKVTCEGCGKSRTISASAIRSIDLGLNRNLCHSCSALTRKDRV